MSSPSDRPSSIGGDSSSKTSATAQPMEITPTQPTVPQQILAPPSTSQLKIIQEEDEIIAKGTIHEATT